MRRLTDADPRREQRRQSNLLDKLERRFRARFRSEIARAMRDITDRYEVTGDVMPPRDHRENVERLFEDMAFASVTTFAGRVVDQGKALGMIETKESFTERFRRFALSYVQREAVRRKITSITETTRERIISEVDKGYRAGLGVAEIARSIRDSVPTISTLRGAIIARTETHGAANFGADVAAKETGLPLRREWIAAADERTRQSHREADGQVVDMEQAFDVGGALLMYPGDPDGPPGEVVNCRCAVSHIVQE